MKTKKLAAESTEENKGTPPQGMSEKTPADEAADARNAIGGQGVDGSVVEEEKETMTIDELKNSKQPLAPEKPLEVPKTTLADAFDTTDAAADGTSEGAPAQEEVK